MVDNAFYFLFTANYYVKSCFNKTELKQNADIRLLKALNLLRETTAIILFVVTVVTAQALLYMSLEMERIHLPSPYNNA